MKELNRKVFNTIFLILSLFVIFGVFAYNLETYKREYESVRRNLTFIGDKGYFGILPNPQFQIDKDLDNMKIMDYEVYTVIISNNTVKRIISHTNYDSDFDIENISKSIVNRNQGLNIGNLYNNKYSYNYSNNTIIIMNTASVNSRLSSVLGKTAIVFIIMETVVYCVSSFLTKRITKPAQESFDKQKDFIADASHELKTPLAVIMASADELKSDKKNAKYIDNIKHESERMSTLIKSLLDLSKLEKGISIANYKDEDISKVVERTCLTFEAIAFEKSVRINTNIEKDIIFKCSKEEIERLISILLDNAIKHSYEKTSISVNLNKDKNNIEISIINSGDPIKPGDEEKIFERFYRADKSRNRDANRYGLGLAIAKKIVTNHNGTIKAFSKNGKTTFKIILKK